ncbi:SM/Sec1-family protein [Dunaliella salina]|uniref:SM/Sec1-family protein n=1 Tax=Dunaliella salina TaxID=3046 RepID=A0ABQ7GB73_DUNSA|nr:SM/Sec1-family protein [Dunaliella salina]|eukprot:KAF5831862.1 SM/Sec1-family protein [Dunaliella salina]
MLDLVQLLRAYIYSALSAVPGYKALLVDKDTMRMCSMLLGRSELADRDVVHVEQLDHPTSSKKSHQELKAIILLRPTRDNITILKRELKAPRYQQSNVYFTNLLSPIHLQEVAEADALREHIQGVHEVYGDVCAVSGHHFFIPVTRNNLLISNQSTLTTTEFEAVDRCVQGLSALLLAMRGRPVVRYQRGSTAAYELARSLYTLVYKQHQQTFDFGNRSSPALIILDRKDDPVTPLLNQWTYEAMIHELLGIHDKTTKLQSSSVPEDMREMVLDAGTDDFFAKHAYLTFGEVGISVKALMEQYQSREAQHRQVESLEDMRRFVTEHMDFTNLQSNVTKHVNLMSNLSDIAGKRRLLELSEIEQDLASPATNVSAAGALDEVMRMCRQPDILDKDKVRLALLYALRFEHDASRVQRLIDCLEVAGVKSRDPTLFGLVPRMLAYAGSSKRVGDLYASRSIMNKAKTMIKGLKGADNVFTQHTPLLAATLSNFLMGQLDIQGYPFIGMSQVGFCRKFSVHGVCTVSVLCPDA